MVQGCWRLEVQPWLQGDMNLERRSDLGMIIVEGQGTLSKLAGHFMENHLT